MGRDLAPEASALPPQASPEPAFRGRPGSSAGQDHAFPGLTALRGIAALLVVLFHAPKWGLSAYFVGVTQFAAHGYLWVDFFFILSGFVMAHAYGGRFLSGEAGAWRRYARARFARIYPLHLVILLSLGLFEVLRPWTFGEFYPQSGRPISAANFTGPLFAESLALVQGLWDDTPRWNPPAWSISCEAVAYLLFPALWLRIARGGWTLVLSVAAACELALAAIVLVTPQHSLSAQYLVVQCLADLTLGLCLYRLHAAGRIPAPLSGDRAAAAILLGLAASLHLGLSDLVIVPQLGLLLVIAAVNRRRLAAVLAASVPQFLGRISYSIYLIHWPLFYVAAVGMQWLWGEDVLFRQAAPTRAGIAVVAMLVVIGAASLTYRFVELPCRSAILRLGARRGAERAPIAPDLRGVAPAAGDALVAAQGGSR